MKHGFFTLKLGACEKLEPGPWWCGQCEELELRDAEKVQGPDLPQVSGFMASGKIIWLEVLGTSGLRRVWVEEIAGVEMVSLQT